MTSVSSVSSVSSAQSVGAEPDEIACTAYDKWTGDPTNHIFAPPCACPRCAPEPPKADEHAGSWLRVSGRRQRVRVEALALGPHGTALLG